MYPPSRSPLRVAKIWPIPPRPESDRLSGRGERPPADGSSHSAPTPVTNDDKTIQSTVEHWEYFVKTLKGKSAKARDPDEHARVAQTASLRSTRPQGQGHSALNGSQITRLNE